MIKGLHYRFRSCRKCKVRLARLQSALVDFENGGISINRILQGRARVILSMETLSSLFLKFMPTFRCIYLPCTVTKTVNTSPVTTVYL